MEFGLRSSLSWFWVDGGPAFSHAVAGQFDAVGVVHEAIEDGVGDGGIADDFIPVVDRDLAGDDDRAPLVAVFDDLEEVAALIVVELFRSPIVEDEQVGSGEGLQRPGVSAVASCQGERSKEPRGAMIGDGEVLAAGVALPLKAR